MPSPRETFLDTFSREHATTMKVLRAFPADKGEFRAHPQSQSARELAWTFVMEQHLITLAVNGTLRLGGGMPKPPEDFGAVIAQFDRDFADLVELLTKTPDSRFETGTVTFPTGPGKMGEHKIGDFCWFMLFDQIHHRGQYSVMLRLAGGKVPSIYGPSHDEPWM